MTVINAFEITVQQRAATGWPVAVAYAIDGSAVSVSGTLQLDPAAVRLLDEDARAYGTALGEALFTGRVRDAFIGARAREERALRVLLDVADPDLRTLRWERLCGPIGPDGGWAFLALDQSVPFSMDLPSESDRRFPLIGRNDLRALVVVASPKARLEQDDLDPFDVGETVASIRRALDPIETRVLADDEIVDDVAGPPTIEALGEALTEFRPTLLHIVCHGKFAGPKAPKGETFLFLDGPDGSIAPIDGTSFIARLAEVGGDRGLPHFVFLGTCESARPEAEAVVGGLAQRLVRELGIQAVVAMTAIVTVATAEELTTAFYERLRTSGEVDRALVEARAGLTDPAELLIPALYGRLHGRPLFDDSLDRPLTATDIALGLERLEELMPERAPVLRARFEELQRVLLGTADADPAALSPDARAARGQALEDIQRLCLDVADISFSGLASGLEAPAYPTSPPFRGLAPFGSEQHESFTGRGELVERLVARLSESPFLAVVGPSGSGKTSLVLAGLLHTLGAHAVVVRPGEDPAAELEARLNDAAPSAVIVADGFEALFVTGPGQASRERFIERLLAATGDRRVIVTMRSDWLPECAAFPTLVKAMDGHRELIAPMDAAELREAMGLQARSVGLKFDTDVENTLMEDVADQPGAMSLLQLALLGLWDRRHGRLLPASGYRASGGIQRAICDAAEAFYLGRSEHDRARLLPLFTRLTSLGQAPVPGQTRADSPRRVHLQDLVPKGTDPAATRLLVKELADADLVVTSLNTVDGEPEVEVAHAAIVRQWPRLRAWLDEGYEAHRDREDITDEAREWDAGGRPADSLLRRGTRLQEALAVARQPGVLNDTEQAYLDAASAQQLADAQRSVRRRNLAIAGLLVGAVAFAGLSLYAFGKRQEAIDEKAIADQARAIAIEARSVAEERERESFGRRLAGQSTVISGDRVDVSLLLAAQAYRTHANVATEGRLLAATQCCSPALLGFMSGPTDRNWDVAFSPDGARLASTGNDGLVRIWDVATRREVARIQDQTTSAVIYALAFSPDGRILAVGNAVPRVVLYDTTTWRPIARLLGHTESVFSLKFSTDGRTLVSGGIDGKVFAWAVSDPDAVVRRELQPGRPKPGWVYDAAIAADGTLVAAVTRDGRLMLWDLSEQDSEPDAAVKTQRLELGAAFAGPPDRPFILTSDAQGLVAVWDLRPWLETRTALEPAVPVRSALLDPIPDLRVAGEMYGLDMVAENDVAFVTGGDTGVVRRDRIVFDQATGSIRLGPESLGLTGHNVGVYRIDVSPDGALIAAAGRDRLVSLWQARETLPVVRHVTSVSSVRSLLSGTALVSVDASAELLRSDTLRGIEARVRLDIALPPNATFKSSISPDGSRVAVADTTGRLLLLDGGDGRRLAEAGPDVGPAPGKLTSVAFNGDGGRLAVGDGGGRIRVWSVAGGTLEGPIATYVTPRAADISALAFSPDGRTLIAGGCGIPSRVGCEESAIFILDAESLVLRRTVKGKSGLVPSLVFDPHPDRPGRFAVGSIDGTVTIWDIEGRQLTLQVTGTARTSALTYQPGGALLAVGAERRNRSDPDVFLLDAITLEPFGGRFRDHDHTVTTLSFSADGKTLMSGSLDATIVFHDLRPERWLERACQLANRNLTGEEWALYVGETVPYAVTCPAHPVDPSPPATYALP